jgi:hypothetical protein
MILLEIRKKKQNSPVIVTCGLAGINKIKYEWCGIFCISVITNS